MDLLQAAADHCIRRVLGFLGLGVGLVMLLLSFDPPLALRAGADLLAMAWAGMLIAAWCTPPHAELRRDGFWGRFQHMAGGIAGRVPRQEIRRLLSGILRSRLIWHAKRIGVAAAAMWVLSFAIEGLDR